MPIDWAVDRLSSAWDVIDCKHVTAEFVRFGVPVVSIREVQSRFVDITSANYTTVGFYERLIEGGRKPRSGDLILSRNATVGEIAQVADWHPPFAMGQDVCLLRKKMPGYSSGFLQSVFRSEIVSRQLENLMVGSTFRRVNVQQVKALMIPLPSVAEQRVIAEALSDVDDLLAALDVLIAKKQAIKQGTMQQLLTGTIRLPGFSRAWETIRLGDHVTFLRHGVNSRAELTVDGPVKYLHYGDIHTTAGEYLDPDRRQMPSLPAERARTLDRLQQGDLVLVDASEDLDGIGKSVELRLHHGHEVVSGLHTIAARFDKTVLADGFKAYMQFCPAFREHLRRLAAGTKVFATNREHIAMLEMQLPRCDEQIAISSVLSDMATEIAALETRRDKTRDIKQGMLQQLLTGRVRLVKPTPEKTAA